MSVEATLWKSVEGALDYTPTTAKAAGEVVELEDGRAGVVQSVLEAAQMGSVAIEGIFTMLKTASIVLLKGQQVYWVRSTGMVSYTGDFAVGTVFADAASADTTVKVILNGTVKPVLDLMHDPVTTAATDGLGVTETQSLKTLAFDAVAENAMAAVYTVGTIPLAAKPILEGWVAIYDIGDDTALDISIGLANGTHATDFDSGDGIGAIPF